MSDGIKPLMYLDFGLDYEAIKAERPKCVTGSMLYDECMRQWREWAHNATREAAETFSEFLEAQHAEGGK